MDVHAQQINDTDPGPIAQALREQASQLAQIKMLNSVADKSIFGGADTVAALIAQHTTAFWGTEAYIQRLRTEQHNSGIAKNIRPMTTIPQPGNVDTLPGYKTYCLPMFEGFPHTQALPKGATQAVIGWLNKVMATIVEYNLTHAAGLKLLMRHLHKDASQSLSLEQEGIVRKGGNFSLQQAVVAIETQYAGLLDTAAALQECFRYRREPGEALMNLGRRINTMALMAQRHIEDENVRHLVIQETSRAAFSNALDDRLRVLVQERLANRMRNGESVPEFFELVAEAQTIESRERGHGHIAALKTGKGPDHSLLRVTHTNNSDSDDDAQQFDVNYVANTRKSTNKNKRFNASKTRRNASDKVIRMLNQLALDDDSATTSDDEHTYDPNTNEASNVLFIRRGTINPQMVNVGRNDCLRCGLPGHRAFGESRKQCPLRAEEVTDKPCPFCKKGGHLANKCPHQKVSAKNL